MKAITIVVFLLTNLITKSQDFVPNVQMNFSAIVVKNASESMKWYQSVFALKVKNEINDPNQSYKIVILESPDYSVELLELKGSLIREDLLKGKPEGTQVQGHFKIGFKISNADEWLKHFAKLKIEVPRVWTDQKTGKKNFIIQDLDGNLIQLFEF